MTNDNENIDILEEVINAYDPEVMERLLWDYSRPTDDSLKNNLNVDGHHHIYWATDMYAGNGFDFMDEILVSSITGENSRLVRPRCPIKTCSLYRFSIQLYDSFSKGKLISKNASSFRILHFLFGCFKKML